MLAQPLQTWKENNQFQSEPFHHFCSKTPAVTVFLLHIQLLNFCIVLALPFLPEVSSRSPSEMKGHSCLASASMGLTLGPS